MHIAEFNTDDFQSSHQSKMDEGLLVKFFIKARPDQGATAREGRPMFKDVEYIDIRVPGDRGGGVCRPARGRDVDRFPRHYEAFKSRVSNEDLVEGTLLSEWPLIGRSQVEELSFAHVKTVEQLIAMPDSNAQQFMGMNVLRAKAKEWLELASEAAAKSELKAELSKRDDDIAELKAQVKALQATPKPRATRKKRAKKKATAKKE